MTSTFASLLSPKEAAALLAVTEDWLYRRRRAGLNPRYHRVGNQIRYRTDDLEEFLEECRGTVPRADP